MTLLDAIAAIRITEVWGTLGGAALRHGRGRAFWRGGDGYNVALDDEKATWFDHARGKGGGVLDLICLVLSCDRTRAVAWLAEAFDLDIDHARPLSPSEKARYRRARQDAELFMEWREWVLEVIRRRRNFHLERYHQAKRFLLAHTLDHPAGDRVADAYERHERRYQQLDSDLSAIEKAAESVLLPFFYESWHRSRESKRSEYNLQRRTA